MVLSPQTVRRHSLPACRMNDRLGEEERREGRREKREGGK